MKKVSTKSVVNLAKRLVGASDLAHLAAIHSYGSPLADDPNAAGHSWSTWLLQGRDDIPNCVNASFNSSAAWHWHSRAPKSQLASITGLMAEELTDILKALEKNSKEPK